MTAKLRSWWEQIRKYRRAIGVVAIVLIVVVVIALILEVVLSNGTGFNGYNKVSTVHTISGPSAGTVTRTEEYQPGKTLWDWLQLLIIPLVLAVGGYLFNLTINRNEQRAAKLRDETDRAIALDNQREIALQAYFDKMSELLFEKNLRESLPEDEVRFMARARTLTVLRGLDGTRKGSLLQFLSEADLIPRNMTAGVLNLKGADLSRVYMRGADMSGIILEDVDLEGADLRRANLSKAILVKADLTRSWLGGADLSKADLREAFLGAANLFQINLSGANLSGAKLIQADLWFADLRDADLSNAYLGEANLSGADLRGANLSGASLYKANLRGAKVTPEQLDVTTSEEKGFKW